MDAVRKGLFFPGSETIAGYPTLDVTENEIIVANIANLEAWVGLDSWDIQPENDRFLDRVSDEPYYTLATTPIDGRYATASDGSLVYTLQGISDAIKIPNLETSGDFTVAVVCGTGLSLGSYTATTNTDDERAWYAANGATTATGLQVVFAGINSGSADAYSGPAWSSTALNVFIMTVNRSESTITCRVNGEEWIASNSASVATNSPVDGVAFGQIRADGASQVQRANCSLAAAVAVSGSITSAELSALEAMLMARAGR